MAIDFWVFLGAYYGFYNLVGLLWIQKVFNIYHLNWYPSRLSFAAAFTLANAAPLAVGALLYRWLPPALVASNLTWIFLTFATMCTPLLVAGAVLARRRHGGFRGPTETQLLFAPAPPARRRRRAARSHRRFLWLCAALLLSLGGYVLGETYSELYLRTLPHSALETVVYVYAWVLTVGALDGATGWVLGARVRSYPLQTVFKLYFALTYQTYVRALYARLRAPAQFAALQALSSARVVLWHPLAMTRAWHALLVAARVTGLAYADWQRHVGRAFFLRGLAESVSMLAFLGWCAALRAGANRDIYPYFTLAGDDGYTFALTFGASAATWAAELLAGWIVRRVMRAAFGYRVTHEAVRDFAAFPELLPACLCVPPPPPRAAPRRR